MTKPETSKQMVPAVLEFQAPIAPFQSKMGRQHISSLALLLPVLASTTYAASDPPRPRGVGPDCKLLHQSPTRPCIGLPRILTTRRVVAKFYKDPETFTCISNPTIKIHADRVNDDYCDCPDGSDEPGTAACAFLSSLSPSQPSTFKGNQINHTTTLPGFYCKNKGHRPGYVPFTNVNDGICDYEFCCDGSDEYDRIGGVKCEDQCVKIGKEWKKQDEIRQKSVNAARQRRKELVDEAGRLHKEVEDRITTLKTEIEAGEIKVDALTKSLAEIERQERGKVIRGAGKGGKVTVLASLAKEKIRELTEGIYKVLDERDAARKRVQELEEMLRRFKEEYNPNFNDEGVKRAVKAWEDYAAQEWPGPNDALDRDIDEMTNPESESAIKWEEYETPTTEESDIDVRKFMSGTVCYKVDTKARIQSTNSKSTFQLPSATG